MQQAVIWVFSVLALCTSLWGQEYKADRGGSTPAALAEPIAHALVSPGYQINRNGAAYCEIWVRASLPSGGASSEAKTTITGIAAGTLLGAVQFDVEAKDRRGQVIRPGLYTLRYGIMPANSDHEGASPHRDFLILAPAREDRDLGAVSNLDSLLAMSRKVSGTMHPAVLSIWKAQSDAPGFSEEGDGDWVLESKVGDIPMAVIIAGTAGN